MRSTTAGIWLRQLRDRIFNLDQEAERVNWKWSKAMNFQSLPPMMHFLQQDGTTCPNVATDRDQVLIGVSDKSPHSQNM